MGMFDYVAADLFCCYCGIQASQDFQCKDGPCLLDVYTREAFEDLIFEKSQYRLAGTCNNCKNNLQYLIWNKSAKHSEYIDQQIFKSKRNLQDEQTSQHPNHPFGGGNLCNYYVLNAYCNKCQEMGVENGSLPPDVTAEHKKLIEQQFEVFKEKSLKVFKMCDEISGVYEDDNW